MKALGKSVMYETLEEIVNPEHTVLVIWDVQNALVESIFNRKEYLQNQKIIIAAARSARLPIVYTQIEPLPADYESPWRMYWLLKRFGVDDPEKLPPFLKPRVPESEFDLAIPNEVRPEDNDTVLHKHTPSIFIGTYFENMMKNRGIDTILFTGIATEIGIASSARDSSNRGFYTIVVEDCVSSSSQDMHEAALKTLSRVCLVLPSKDIREVWK